MNISHEPSAKALLGKISVRGIDRKNKNDQGPRKITSILGYKRKVDILLDGTVKQKNPTIC